MNLSLLCVGDVLCPTIFRNRKVHGRYISQRSEVKCIHVGLFDRRHRCPLAQSGVPGNNIYFSVDVKHVQFACIVVARHFACVVVARQYQACQVDEALPDYDVSAYWVIRVKALLPRRNTTYSTIIATSILLPTTTNLTLPLCAGPLKGGGRA